MGDVIPDGKKIEMSIENINTYTELQQLLEKLPKKTIKSRKFIHQVWFPIKQVEIFDCWKESPKEWKKYHPDWIYILWNKELSRDFIKHKESLFLETWENFKYEIQRIDAIRQVFLKHLGGIYSDLDVVPLKSMDKYFRAKLDYFVPSANVSKYYTNAIMASFAPVKDTRSIWDDCLTEMKKNTKWWAMGKHLTVMTSTGPMMLSEVLKKTSKSFCRLSTKFMPNTVSEVNAGTNRITEENIIKMLPGSSWCGWDTKLFITLYENKNTLIFIFIITLVIIIIIIINIIYKYFKYKKIICENKDLARDNNMNC